MEIASITGYFLVILTTYIMLNKVLSKVNGKIICSYVYKNQIADYRTDLSEEHELMQGSARILKKDIYVKPHKHLAVKREIYGTQESWVVVEGKVLATLYDLDDTKLREIELNAGSCMIFYRGGHSLKVMDDNTIFYEFKNGPYLGYENDKSNI